MGRPSPGLMARPGKSIAKQSEGRAGEKYLPVVGRVRSRALLSILYAVFLLSKHVHHRTTVLLRLVFQHLVWVIGD